MEPELYLVIVGNNGTNVWMTRGEAERLDRRLKSAVEKGVVEDYDILNEFEHAVSHEEFLKSLDKQDI